MAGEFREKNYTMIFCFILLTVLLVLTLSPLFFMFYTSVKPAGSAGSLADLVSTEAEEAVIADLTTNETQGLVGEDGVAVTGTASAATRFVLTNPEAGFSDQVYEYLVDYNNGPEGTTSVEATLPVPQIHRFKAFQIDVKGNVADLLNGVIVFTDEYGAAVQVPLADYLPNPQEESNWQTITIPIEAVPFGEEMDVRFIKTVKIEWSAGEGTLAFREINMDYVAFTLLNYIDILTMRGTSIRDFLTGGFGRYFLNSFFISTVVTIGNIIFAAMAGYVFARREFPMKNIIFMIIIGTLMIPPQVTMVPMFVLMKGLGWLNSYWALIIPALAIPFNIFLLRQYIKELPVTLEEAARIDGANDFQIFYHVVLPLCKPVLAVVGINTFMGSWNTFLFPFILTNSDDMYTLPVGLALYKSTHASDWVHMMAGAAITAIPVIIVFLMFQKMIIAGLTSGAVKE